MSLTEMSVICPTVTAADAHTYRAQIERIESFAQHVHIDMADGKFATKSLDIGNIWLPENKVIDFHLMYQNPIEIIDQIIALKPRLVIVHAEADGDFNVIANKLRGSGIKVGVALLEPTPVEVIIPEINGIDHVLVFSGNLGHFGGKANLELLEKVKKIKDLDKAVEIGWDGGINNENVEKLAEGGVDVLNVGGFIQQSSNSVDAYVKLNLALMGEQS
jgi:ribulose-phosphate 3-epimerase